VEEAELGEVTLSQRSEVEQLASPIGGVDPAADQTRRDRPLHQFDCGVDPQLQGFGGRALPPIYGSGWRRSIETRVVLLETVAG
jgi:hypothetical protein